MSSELRRGLLVLGALVAAWTMIGIPAHATYGARVTADEPQYLLTAISLGDDGDLDIADELADEAYRPFHRVDLDPQTLPARRRRPPDQPARSAAARRCSRLPMRVGGWVGGEGDAGRARRGRWRC